MKWYYEYLPVNEAGDFDFNAYLERTANAEHNVWMPVLIILCILAIWIICKFVRRLHANDWHASESLLEDNLRTGNTILVAVTNILIILYVLMAGSSALWFMFPGPDGNWLRVAVCGVIYLYALVNLLVGILKTLDDYCDPSGGRVSVKWGIITMAIGVIALIGCALAVPQYLVYVVLAFILCQMVQLWMIYSKAISGGWSSVLMACGTYILGSIALITFAAPFFILMIVLAIMLLMFTFILKSSMEEDKKRDVIIYDDGRIVDKYNGTEYEKNSDGTLSPKYP